MLNENILFLDVLKTLVTVIDAHAVHNFINPICMVVLALLT